MEKPLHPYQYNYATNSPKISSRKIFIALFSLIIAASLLLFNDAKAQTLPSGFSQVMVANGITNPTVMAFAPDGRIFVAQQTGQLRIIKNGTLLSQPFISLSVSSSGERGLLGIAFDPNFNSNGYIYLYYTLSSAANNRISRFTANGDVVVAGSEMVLLNLDPLSGATNHNGGTMQFGPDGKLYVGVGENADAAYSQRTDTYHGKLLRINPDGTVPTGNPFTTGNNQQLRIWSYGLRNPYTISFQPGTGKLFVNDVGSSVWEEINDATAGGKNYGWPQTEGNGSSSYSNPAYAYPHGGGIGSGCAITGGTFFNPSATNYPSANNGRYFFLDYCNNWIDMLTLSEGSATRSNFASNIAGSPVSLVTGNDGNLYFLSRDNSAVYKITYTGSSGPVITNQPQSLTIAQGNTATFTITVTGGAPLTYQWRKNGINISGAVNSSYSLSSATAANAGNYSVVVNNSSGTVTSNDATLTVTSANQPPVATITTPEAGATYAGGSVISFSGTATDPENGNLGVSSYSWYVLFHHDTHTHPGPSATTGAANGSFTIPNTGETAPNVFYRLYLVVTDQQGAKDTAYTDISPRTSTITLNTVPQGLTVTLDGQPFTAPLTVTSVEGVLRAVGTVSPQTINSSAYNYNSWSQGGLQTQTIATPVNDVVYTANFVSPVVITSQPQSIVVAQGSAATFNVTATGAAALTYQWRMSGVNISGATSSTFTIASVTTANAGTYSVVVGNAAGNVTSNNATLTVTTSPVISDQPQNITTTAGNVATFTVTASGTAPLSYQWRKSGVNINGATGSAYTIASVTAASAGTYSVVVSNASGNVTSNNATLTVTTSPVISDQPQNITTTVGNAATFTVTVSGTAPLSYQWRKSGVNINGATGSAYTIASVTAASAGTYSVVVSNVSGNVTSNNATLTITTSPVISDQPQNITTTVGNAATFTVTVSGTAPLSYQWRKSEVNINGATGSAYTIASVTGASAGTYSVVVSNASGNVTSNNATLTVTSSPVITSQPQNITMAAGNAATFTVTATGTAPLTYQWRKTGVIISGATSSVYTMASVTAASAGTYSVVVSNASGTVTSNNAILTVNSLPVITNQPQNSTVAPGNAATFSVSATSTAPLNYRWRKNGRNISGATSSVYTIASVTTGSAGTYSVRVASSSGTVISNNATLTVTSSPVITNQPQNTTVTAGAAATFSVTATGTAPLSYQWRRNGVDITDATGSVYTIASVMAASAGIYSVLLSNAAGNVTSNNATLTVISPNQAPAATIISPLPGASYAGGDIINFSGSATDPENGTLEASSFFWYVVLNHDGHEHPGPTAESGVVSGSFTIPNTGETESDVFYRLYLVVTDQQGAKDTAYTDIFPRTSIITLNSVPEGLIIMVDGQPFTTPLTVTSVEGLLRTIDMPGPQTINGSSYTFGSWSQGGLQTQTFATPADDVVYTASFETSSPSSLREPDNPSSTVNGLDYSYYHGTWNVIPDWTKLGKQGAGNVLNFDLSPTTESDNFGFRFTGYISVPADGIYTFYTFSDEGSKLYIGDSLIVNNDGLHTNQEQSGQIGLKVGKHRITVDYFEKSAQQILTVSYEGDGIPKQLIPASVLFRNTPALIVLNPVADAFVRSGTYNNINVGANPSLITSSAGTTPDVYQTYLRFDISSVRSGLSSVKLRLYGGSDNSTVSPVTVQVFNVTSQEWMENTITNAYKPVPQTTELASTSVVGTTGQYYEWDLTQHIINLRNSGTLYVSLLVKNSTNTGTALITFNSKENAGNKPELKIEYAPLITQTRGVNIANGIVKAVDGRAEAGMGSVSIYPNPAINNFTLKYSPEFRKRRLRIADANGKQLKEVLLTGAGSQNIKVANLRDGLYFIYIDVDGKRYSQQIMIRN